MALIVAVATIRVVRSIRLDDGQYRSHLASSKQDKVRRVAFDLVGPQRAERRRARACLLGLHGNSIIVPVCVVNIV